MSMIYSEWYLLYLQLPSTASRDGQAAQRPQTLCPTANQASWKVTVVQEVSVALQAHSIITYENQDISLLLCSENVPGLHTLESKRFPPC